MLELKGSEHEIHYKDVLLFFNLFDEENELQKKASLFLQWENTQPGVAF